MLPGLTTRVSEEAISLTTSITPKSDLVRVTSTATTTACATIVPAYQGFSGVLFLANKSGASITLTTAGNIAGTGTITVLNQRMAVLVFSAVEGKWSVANDT